MSALYFDRVKETTATAGTGALVLGGAPTGYRAFGAVLADAQTCYYCVAARSGGAWEVGLGTYSAAGNTLARTAVLASSNAGAAVDLPAGTKDVFLDVPAAAAAAFARTDGSNTFAGVQTGSFNGTLAGTATLAADASLLNGLPGASYLVGAPADSARNEVVPGGDFTALTLRQPAGFFISAPILDIRSNNGAVSLARFNALGKLEADAGVSAGVTALTPDGVAFNGGAQTFGYGNNSVNLAVSSPSDIPLTISLWNSPNAVAFRVMDANGASKASIGSDGVVAAAGLTAQPAAASNKGLVVKGATSQSANLQEWQDSTGAALASVTPAGALTTGALSLSAAGVTRTGTAGNFTWNNTTGGGGNFILTNQDTNTSLVLGTIPDNGGITGQLAFATSAAAAGTPLAGVTLHARPARVLRVTNGLNTIDGYGGWVCGVPATGTAGLVVKALQQRAVTNKALASNVATLTTSRVHQLTVGDSVTVAGVDATFDGTFTVASVPGNTSFTYAKVAANVASQAATGTVTPATSANLLECQDSGGVALANVTPAGGLAAVTLTARPVGGSTSVQVSHDGTNAVIAPSAGLLRVQAPAAASNSTPVFDVRSRLGDRSMFRVTDNAESYVNSLRLGTDVGAGFVVKMGSVNETEWRFAGDAAFTWTAGTNWAAATDAGLGRSAAGVLKATNGSTGLGGLLVGQPAVGTPGLTVRQITSGTANLQEWQDSTGAPLLKVGPGGAVRFDAAAGTTSFGTGTGAGFYGDVSHLYFVCNGSSQLTLTDGTQAVFFGSIGANAVDAAANLHARASSAGAVPFSARGVSGQTANLTEWQGTGGSALAAVDKNGGFAPASMADAAAANGTLYFSTTANKLVFKDAGGVVNALY